MGTKWTRGREVAASRGAGREQEFGFQQGQGPPQLQHVGLAYARSALEDEDHVLPTVVSRSVCSAGASL